MEGVHSILFPVKDVYSQVKSRFCDKVGLFGVRDDLVINLQHAWREAEATEQRESKEAREAKIVEIRAHMAEQRISNKGLIGKCYHSKQM